MEEAADVRLRGFAIAPAVRSRLTSRGKAALGSTPAGDVDLRFVGGGLEAGDVKGEETMDVVGVDELVDLGVRDEVIDGLSLVVRVVSFPLPEEAADRFFVDFVEVKNSISVVAPREEALAADIVVVVGGDLGEFFCGCAERSN